MKGLVWGMLDVVCLGITLFLLLGVGIFYHIVLKVSPEESWATALMTVMSVIFVIGLFNTTKIALGIIYVIGIAGVIGGVISAVRHCRYSICSFFSPSIIMIIVVMGVGVVAFHGMHITNWDELFQWGKAANYMVLHDRLPIGADFSGHDILLSTTTIFHYFMARIGAWRIGQITESDYYISNLLLWFSAVILPFSGNGWQSWKKVWAFGIFQFLFVAIAFVQPYYNIYTDQPTAYWAGALITWMVLNKCNKKNCYLIPLILLNVGLMKSMVGPLFAVIVMLTAVVNYYSQCRYNKSKLIPQNWKKNIMSAKSLFLFFTLLSSVLYTVILSFVIKENAVYRGDSDVANYGRKSIVKTIKAMISKLFEALNKQNDSLYLSYIGFFVITLIVVFVLYPLIMDQYEYLRFHNLLVVYLAGFGGFFLIMLYAYQKVFGYVDSITAMSLERYFSDYVMLGILPLTMPFFVKLQKIQSKNIVLLKRFVLLGSVFCMIVSCSGYVLPRFAHIYAVDTGTYKERERFLSYAKQAKQYTNEKGKIYFINQHKSGLFTLVADYELGDQLSREGMCYKFREDRSEEILGLTDYDIETFPNVLIEEEYEYLWVYATDDYFTEKMKELFGERNVEDGYFYHVSKDGNETVLEYLGKIK